MSRVHLALVWHMHQPQYRDPATHRYILPWTRLHAVKDYWGMVRALEATPEVHATFNVVPSLARQIEEYASGKFNDPWFDVAFKSSAELTVAEKHEILHRAFQLNHEQLMSRWPRFVELFKWSQRLGNERASEQFGVRDWCDLQILSQLAWMDEEYLANDAIVSALVRQGSSFSELDKENLRAKQAELLRRVLPEYRRAAERGQIEISTTPFYHPILPLLCDSQIARVANPHSPSLTPSFRFPEDAKEQLVRAQSYHARLFGKAPEGLWPSEGSVSDEILGIAAELGFRWFATDEGVLGRTRNIGFWRDADGVPENARELYSPWKFRIGGREIYGFFRDHYLSDLVGFVYARMGASEAAEDFHRRLRRIGDRTHPGKPATVAVILDGENAWEYYPGNGREFLRQLYERIAGDPDIRALTVSEAIAQAGDVGTLEGIFPASWINANFDIWIGHSQDIRAWELLRNAREAYAKVESEEVNVRNENRDKINLPRAREALLAAEGSDWCWWYGPENSSSTDAEFDELYRKHLTEAYVALGQAVPPSVSEPIKRTHAVSQVAPPTDWLRVQVDGRVSSYFEWLGAGYYSTIRRGGAMYGQMQFIGEIFYGFNEEYLFVRIDPLCESFAQLGDCEFRITLGVAAMLHISVRIHNGKLLALSAEQDGLKWERRDARLSVAVGKVIEAGFAKSMFTLAGQTAIRFGVSLWREGLALDLVPREGLIDLPLGEDFFAWPVAPAQDVRFSK
ncbi:MAG TPA: glycoside hydrolase family 57 protein [Candidatus Acidoferrales bacterium]|nr:glycoside hydrolase family 57 protein [Candidatus Acidoferrales bacterium]